MRLNKIIFIDYAINNKKNLNDYENHNKLKLYNRISKLKIDTIIVDKNKILQIKIKTKKNYCRKIYFKYLKKKINLNLNLIYKVDNFLKLKKNKNTCICSGFLTTTLEHLEIIFYELAKIHNIKFLKPERSAFKNRFQLSSSIFKNHLKISKKNFSELNLKKLKHSYSQSFFSIRQQVRKKTKLRNFLNYLSFKNFIKLSYYQIFKKKFIVNKIPKKNFALLILSNDTMMNQILNINYIKVAKIILKKLKLDLVIQLHPNQKINNYITNLYDTKMDIVFRKYLDRINIISDDNICKNLLKNSSLILHGASSLSVQSLIYNKEILSLSKENPYFCIKSKLKLSNLNKFASYKKNSKLLNKQNNDKKLNFIISNSVNHKGKIELSNLNKKFEFKKYNKEEVIFYLLKSYIATT